MSTEPTTEPTTEPQSNTPDGGTPEGAPKPQETTFSPADVERIVKERLAQQAKNKFGDYDELKTKAGDTPTLEQRVKDMETRAIKAEQESLRSRIAAAEGVSTKRGPNGEPSDADLILTGTDEATLTAQAQRWAGRESDRKKQGNYAPKEGTTPKGATNTDDREFVRGLFGRAD